MRESVQRGQVLQLLADLHLGVEATLLGHVADAPTQGQVDRAVAEDTVPESADNTPSTMRIVVDLPAPLLPTNPKISPGRTVKVMSRRAVRSPYLLVRRSMIRGRSRSSSLLWGLWGVWDRWGHQRAGVGGSEGLSSRRCERAASADTVVGRVGSGAAGSGPTVWSAAGTSSARSSGSGSSVHHARSSVGAQVDQQERDQQDPEP